ncbi:MAG TPA: 3-carboxy-cis,cis-muconate cycloisomerase [Burkholderiales bacterium]|nr:3-carboxy-cis,cis-muconate cycloisomerase [Burkholderiales bacterium]
MGSTVFDSALYRDMFGTAEMRAIFSDAGYLARCLDVEAALARAQAGLGMIPAAAASEISAKAQPGILNLERLKRETEVVGYPILPLVKQLAAACAGEAGRYVHWGATTQDIMDSALVLQLRAALDLIEADLQGVSAALEALARHHRDTPMAGRTHLQQALPITFGFKAAVWRAPIERHRERLAQLRPRVLVGQFGGAAGTLASLGEQGLAVRAALTRELGLAEPAITWHVARDGLAEAVLFAGLVTGSLAKIATDVMLMMATELGEAFEPFEHGRGGSSTMPQKRNPISSELIVACAKLARQHCALMLDAMVQDFERATGPWHAEWIALPETFLATAGALRQAKLMLAGLTVDAARMQRNLGMTSGLIVAEAVMMGLAPKLGRQVAHDVVYDACRAAAESDRPLLELLAANPQVGPHFNRSELERLLDPRNYLGSAGAMVDRALGPK